MTNRFFLEFKKTSLSALKLVNQHPQIILASALMAVLNLAGRSTSSLVASLILSLILFSWGFVEVELLYEAKQRQKMVWQQLPTLVIKYLQKTWPLIALGLAFFFVLIPMIMTAIFATQLSAGGDEATRQQLILNKVNDFQSQITDTIGLPTFILIIDAITTLISLWFVQVMVTLVVKNQPLVTTLKMATQTVFKQRWFFLGLTLLLSLIGLASRKVLGLSELVLIARVVYLIFSLYLNLAIKATVLTRYLE